MLDRKEYPTDSYLRTTRMSKGELAKNLYGDSTYDCALPQYWIEKCYQSGFDNAASHFIWVYEKGDHVGKPMPLTYTGIKILSVLSK